jgi:hypothetical protein
MISVQPIATERVLESIDITAIIEETDEDSPFPHLPNRVIECARNGVFDIQDAQDAVEALLAIYGEDLAEDVEPIVDEMFEMAFRSVNRGSNPGDRGYVRNTLKQAARHAVSSVYRNPGHAKAIIKHTGAEVKRRLAQHGKEVAKGALRKGMRMVFGKWVKTGGGQ